MTTVSASNRMEVPGILDAVVAAHADVFAFARYVPTGGEVDAAMTPRQYRELLEVCDKKFRAYEAVGCDTWFSRKDHLWTLYEYETGAFRIPKDAKADMIREFLAVYDNLERASKTEGDDDSPHKQGLIKIFNQSREILKKLNVKEIEALGQVFDPEKHNAVMHIEDEKLGENVISQVFQDGFMLGDKVIRHATVQVAN